MTSPMRRETAGAATVSLPPAGRSRALKPKDSPGSSASPAPGGSSGGIMSEKIFALLLRLYPAGFRRRYGEEATRLLRDRLNDERGFARRLRLWFDLLVDCATGLPQAYR